MHQFDGHSLRQAFVQIPVIGPLAKRIHLTLISRPPNGVQFTSSPGYWEDRYATGGNSGAGSYGRLARFKADVLNDFVARNTVESVVEFGCGDGAQLQLTRYPNYTGIDISLHAVDLCQTRFSQDPSKQFFHASRPEADTAGADLALSLDVIYHLVEDSIYETYMSRLVSAATRFLCIYSSNFDRRGFVAHIRHRCFTDWLEANAPQWKLVSILSNPYPEDPTRPNDTSWADFYFFGLD
jgi:hypothetical protein